MESVAKIAIGQSDWDKINATISETLEVAVAPLRPKSAWLKPIDLLKRSGAVSILWAVPLSLLATAGSAVYVAVARADEQARFEEDATNSFREINARLKRIDTSDAIARPEHAASSPTDKSSTIEAKIPLEAAQKNSILLSPDAIQKNQFSVNKRSGAKFPAHRVLRLVLFSTNVCKLAYRNHPREQLK